MSCAPDWCRPEYEPSKCRLTFPNGSIATLYSADKPDRLRGPQHDFAWVDELCAYAQPDDLWNMLMLGLRVGKRPQCVVTTTPKPTRLIKSLVAREGSIIAEVNQGGAMVEQTLRVQDATVAYKAVSASMCATSQSRVFTRPSGRAGGKAKRVAIVGATAPALVFPKPLPASNNYTNHLPGGGNWFGRAFETQLSSSASAS